MKYKVCTMHVLLFFGRSGYGVILFNVKKNIQVSLQCVVHIYNVCTSFFSVEKKIIEIMF